MAAPAQQPSAGARFASDTPNLPVHGSSLKEDKMFLQPKRARKICDWPLFRQGEAVS